MGVPACEAGESIKPGVERGFGSETPGQDGKRIPAREAGGRDVSLISCRPRRGLAHIIRIGPGVPLAEPRSTPGFMLAPASQATRTRAVATALRNLRNLWI